MIFVSVTRDNRGYRGIDCYGHAFFDEKGRDVVCAAASVLIINTINGIEQFTEDAFVLETPNSASEAKKSQENHKEPNFIHFVFQGDISEKSKVLFDVLVMGLEEIQKRYGKKYLTLEIQEV